MSLRRLRLLHAVMMTVHRSTIAVVEDDDSVRKALCRLLRAAGFSSRGYASGQEFLESWLVDPPECVVLDLQMPGLSGMEVQNRLSRAGAAPPTIFITAHDQPGTREECLRAGAAAYLRKPLDAHSLLDAIRGVLTPVEE